MLLLQFFGLCIRLLLPQNARYIYFWNNFFLFRFKFRVAQIKRSWHQLPSKGVSCVRIFILFSNLKNEFNDFIGKKKLDYCSLSLSISLLAVIALDYSTRRRTYLHWKRWILYSFWYVATEVRLIRCVVCVCSGVRYYRIVWLCGAARLCVWASEIAAIFIFIVSHARTRCDFDAWHNQTCACVSWCFCLLNRGVCMCGVVDHSLLWMGKYVRQLTAWLLGWNEEYQSAIIYYHYFSLLLLYSNVVHPTSIYDVKRNVIIWMMHPEARLDVL